MIEQNLIEKYKENYKHFLQPIAQNLENYFIEIFAENSRIERISARSKSVESFSKKASKLVNDELKYKYPLLDIQDQIGVRIICFYLSDINVIEEVVKKYFKPIEEQYKKPKDENEFGYEGMHYILFIPDTIRNPRTSKENCPEFFELQIKTLYQHAWAAANHDLGYKTEQDLTKEQRRRIAFTAAQSWGADYIFDELAKKLHNN
jgi:ppGpp synthetase/RelA/SpoT-type nucleotidyltranferase